MAARYALSAQSAGARLAKAFGHDIDATSDSVMASSL